MNSNLDGSMPPLPSYFFWPYHRPCVHLHSIQTSTLPFHSWRTESELAAFNSCIYSWEMTSVRLPPPTAAANPFMQTKPRPNTLRATGKQILQSAQKTSALFPPNFRARFMCQSHIQHATSLYIVFCKKQLFYNKMGRYESKLITEFFYLLQFIIL